MQRNGLGAAGIHILHAIAISGRGEVPEHFLKLPGLFQLLVQIAGGIWVGRRPQFEFQLRDRLFAIAFSLGEHRFIIGFANIKGDFLVGPDFRSGKEDQRHAGEQ